jgi:hypothetical protein
MVSNIINLRVGFNEVVRTNFATRKGYDGVRHHKSFTSALMKWCGQSIKWWTKHASARTV